MRGQEHTPPPAPPLAHTGQPDPTDEPTGQPADELSAGRSTAGRPGAGTVTFVIGVRVDPRRLRAALERIAPTLREAAVVVGVSEESLSAWVNGHTQPAPDTVTRILAAARVELPDLLAPGTEVTPAVLRWQAGLTIAAAAKAAGISRHRLADLESGTRTLKSRDVPRLAEALHVTPEQIRDAYQGRPVVTMVVTLPEAAMPGIDAHRGPDETRAEAVARLAVVASGFPPPGGPAPGNTASGESPASSGSPGSNLIR